MIRKYKVYELKDCPMIRLNNNILKNFNFNIGDIIYVIYAKNKIVIEKEVLICKIN